MPTLTKPTLFKRILKGALLLCVCIIAFLVLLAIAGKTLQHANEIHQLSLFLARYRIVAMMWRYGVMAAFIMAYPWLIHRLYRKAEDTQKRDKLARRRYAIGFCLFYELIIVHNGLGFLLAKVMGL